MEELGSAPDSGVASGDSPEAFTVLKTILFIPSILFILSKNAATRRKPFPVRSDLHGFIGSWVPDRIPFFLLS
jgi:hypothetical protein